MAFSFVQEAHDFSFSTGQPTITLPSPVTKGNILVCWVRSASPTFQSVNDRAFAWQPVLNKQTVYSGESLSVWYCVVKTSGTFAVNFFDADTTFGAQVVGTNLTSAACQIMEFSGNSLNGFDAAHLATGTGTSAASTVIASAAGGLVIAIPAANGATTTAGAGYTDPTAGAGYSAEYAVQVTAGSYSPAFTVASSVGWGVIALTLKPAEAALSTLSGSLGTAGAGAKVFIQSQTTQYWQVVTADASGNYTASLPGDTYTVMPTKVGKIFSPASATVSTQGVTLTPTRSDTMQRPDENPFSDGGNWTPIATGAGIAAGKLVSHLFETTATGVASLPIWTGNAWANDQYSQATIQTSGGTNANTLRVVARCANSSSIFTAYSLEIVLNGGNHTFQIARWVNTAQTILKTTNISVSAGDTFAIAVSGSNIYAYHNGVLVLSAIDTTLTAGFPGISAYAGDAITNSQLSSWSGGTVAPATVTQNFTVASTVGTLLSFNTTVSDTFNRANESPLSQGGNWDRNSVPVPPWDYPLAILNDKAVMSNPTIVANFAGPWNGDGVSVYQIPVADDCFIEVELDVLTPTALGYGSAALQLCLRSNLNNTQCPTIVLLPLNDGTVLIQASKALTSTPQINLIVPFTPGDKIRFAGIGTTFYVLKNGVILGNWSDSTTYPTPSYLVPIQVGTNQSQVQISNFLGGSAAIAFGTAVISGRVLGTQPYKNGTPVAAPVAFGTAVNWTPSPAHFGDRVTLPKDFGDPVQWTPDPTHFGTKIPGSTVLVTLSGAASATATTDALGNYSFSGLAAGQYTVTPSQAGYTFAPKSLTFTIEDSVNGIDFAAQQ